MSDADYENPYEDKSKDEPLLPREELETKFRDDNEILEHNEKPHHGFVSESNLIKALRLGYFIMLDY